MGTENSSNLPFNFVYLTTESGEFITTEDGSYIIVDTLPYPPAPAYNGSGGNRLLCTSYIVDMDNPRLPAEAKPYASGGKMRDAKGRKIYWD
jgi:hypothetical protein